tara:strand:+ start:276 stop:1373 length:1098 start_codon:yes stop_codon:yes gene_type:complete
MQDLYKAIDSLRKINESPYQEVQLDEKLTPFKGSYDKKTQKLVNFTMKNGDRKTFVAPIDYVKPTSITDPTAKPVINFLNNLGKKVSNKGKELDPFYKEPKQDTKVVKKEPVKVTKKEQPPMDIMGAGTKNKDVDAPRKKVKATAANTKDYEKTLRLQKRLIAKGADIKADGIMGPNTRAAMQKFMKPGAMPTPRPTPKSGGPDKRFITGPELDMPNMKPNNPMAPPEKKISQKNSPGNPFSPDKKIKPQIDRRLTPDLNRYVADKGGNYKPKLAPAPAPNDDNKSFLDRIKNYKLGDLSRGIRDFAVNLNKNRNKNRDMVKKMDKGINPNKIDPKFAGNTKIQTQSKQPTKTMIEQITGKKTCL